MFNSKDGLLTGTCIGLGIGIIGAVIYGIFKFYKSAVRTWAVAFRL